MSDPTKSADTQKFDELSKQRITYEKLPDGGLRGRITITLPGGKTMSFVEDMPKAAIERIQAEIHGCEIGFRIAEGDIAGAIGYADAVFGREGEIGLSIFKRLSRGIKKVAKTVVNSKLLQTAAKGLALVGPFVPGIGTIAVGVGAGLMVAGKLAGAKAAANMGATKTAAALTKDAMNFAAAAAPPGAAASLLKIGSDKANASMALALGTKKPASPWAKRRRRVQRARPRVSGHELPPGYVAPKYSLY